MENLQDSKTLKELGLNEKNQWILFDDKPKAFFEHLAANIDSENILSESELKQYEELRASGQFLEGDALTEELKALESHFPGILTISDEDISEMERELEFLENDTKERKERIARMEDCEKRQLRDIEALETKHCEVDYQVKQLEEECLQKASTLSELQKSNQKKIVDLKQTYLQPQNPPTLVYQMPIDQHFHKCDQLLSSLELFMRKNFNITNSAEEVQSDWLSHTSIIEVKKRIQEVEEKKFEECLTAAGMNSIIANIDQFKSLDSNEMRTMIEEMEVETENMSLEFEVIHKEACMLLEQSTEQEIVNVFHEHFKGKNKRALKRLDTIKSVENIIESIAMLCELLWVVMQLDLERLKNRADNTEEINVQAQDCAKRMRQMKIVSKRDPVASLNQNFLSKLQNVMVENLQVKREELPTIAACLQAYVKYEEEIQVMVKSTVSHENFRKVNEVLKEISNQSDQLREFIFSGPTNRPNLYDTKFLMQIHDKEQKKVEVEKAFECAKLNYKKNIVEPWESDRYFRMEKNLWIYFLTEPKKVHDCIKEVQKKAALKGSVGYKALNITGVSKAT